MVMSQDADSSTDENPRLSALQRYFVLLNHDFEVTHRISEFQSSAPPDPPPAPAAPPRHANSETAEIRRPGRLARHLVRRGWGGVGADSTGTGTHGEHGVTMKWAWMASRCDHFP